ncbi:MAG TPA: preprotein translocase subunit YajC [Chitinophagaceae bacterium]|nr:preprotein translocase subunit YajC [Chitinophagaceae bacterium]
MKLRLSYLLSGIVLFSISSCVPQGGDQKSGGGFGGFQFVFLGLMILVFWMFFIRPQKKRADNQKKFIDDLQRGDKIVTIAGIHGTINKVNEDGTLNIEVSPGSYIKIEKSAISMDWTAALNKPITTVKKMISSQ